MILMSKSKALIGLWWVAVSFGAVILSFMGMPLHYSLPGSIIVGCIFASFKYQNVVKEIKDVDGWHKIEVDRLRHELNAYQEFFRSTYTFGGIGCNYPNWKAQQEFRYLISQGNLGSDRVADIDRYLGKIVDATKQLLIETKVSGVRDLHWNEGLAEARGDYMRVSQPIE